MAGQGTRRQLAMDFGYQNTFAGLVQALQATLDAGVCATAIEEFEKESLLSRSSKVPGPYEATDPN